MTDLLNYFNAQANTRAAEANYNASSTALELARIKERLAQIKSQNAPLSALMDEKMTERERLYAAAFFVVIGRMP